MEIKIPENLQNMVRSIIISNGRVIKIKFTVEHDNEEIAVPFTIKDLDNSIKKLEKKVKETVEISKEEYNEIENIILFELSGNTEIDLQQSSNKNKNKKEVTVNKYSQNRKGNLYESIILGGEPYFLSIDNNGELTFQTSIEENKNIVSSFLRRIPP